ncbi:hypothetical protein B484DRAFT_393720, partial [Ochromonadaceae sp. CCMP2298]
MGWQSEADGFCNGLYSDYRASDYLPVGGGVGLGGVVLGAFYFCSSVITIVWIRQQLKNAQHGM